MSATKVRTSDTREEHDTTIGGFTTLAVPVFFALLYAVALTSGLPVALLLVPFVLQLATVLVPPPTRLTLPTCPYLARRDAIRAALRAARLGESQRPRAFDPKSAPIFDPTRGGIVRLGRLSCPT